MDSHVKIFYRTVAVGLMYLVMVFLLTPVLVKILDRPAGQAVYGLLAIGGLALAIRLRQLSGRL